MAEDIFKGQLTRSSLGRQGFIGELYDIRSESLTSRSLLKSSFPSNLIECRDVGRMEFDYKFTENIADRFDLIDVESELQISILLGLISLEGSGKFLNLEKKSGKTLSCSLLCKLQTVSEKFFASFDEIIQYVDLTALKDSQYTHVIVEVIWGANCILNLESTSKSDTERRDIEGCLSAGLPIMKKCLLSIKGDGKFQKEDLDFLNRKDIQIKICADVLPDNGWPVSAEGFCQFVTDLPKLLKKVNNGKGKPLQYVMIPLMNIRKLAKLELAVDVFVKKIDESFMLSTIYFFDEITKTKQKLNDLLFELNEYKKYVPDDELRNAKKQRENLSIKESELKLIILDDWLLVRTGQKPLKELIKRVEKFKNLNLNLLTYENFIESCSPTLNKLSTVKHYISKGIIYLGKEEKFDTVMSNHLSSEFIVLVISSEIEKEDPDLYRNNCYYFLTMVAECKPNTKYVVVDLDYRKRHWFLNGEITTAKCFHLKGNKVLNSDMYGNHLRDIESDFAQLGQGFTAEYIQHKPGNRVMLEITCPGFEAGTCSPDPVIWDCAHCKTNIEYGFDDYFYCSCGRGPAAAFEYRCGNPRHGIFFIPAKPEFLEKILSTLKPLKELNLLILGQSGVGKSTWINSIVNYLTYDSLQTAKESGVISTIPLSFTMYDSKSLKKQVVQIGSKSENEVTTVGESATQYSHTYNFLWEDRCVRLIDTPGLGDTRGIEQDKKNLRNIIDHIGHLKELHGVCILLKANDTRITPIFAYCLKELLIHLHKSVAKNIVFCFTNARNSFYSPGQTSVLLEKLIDGLGVKKDLGLGYHNMFCLDNEAFLFLCSLENPKIQHDAHLVQSFSQSWEISLRETRRLFDTIKSFQPHLLKETISLVTARSRILSLSKPIAEISKTIQINVAAIERKREEINSSEMAIEELSKKLTFTEIHLESIPLDTPRTVCTSPSCVDYLTYRNFDVSEIEYKTHCHINCQIKDVTPKTVNNALLKSCVAMNKSGKCNHCGCSWENHMHLSYIQKRVEEKVINESVERDMMKEKSAKEEIENFVENLKSIVEKYKKEQEFVIQASVKFGMFLRHNAISYFNDSVAEYLEYLISVEESKPYKSKTEEKVLESMKQTLAHYNAEVQILQAVINETSDNTEEMTVQEVYELEQKLYKLELTGEAIRTSVSLNRSSNEKMLQYAETPLQINRPQKTKKRFFSRILGKINEYIMPFNMQL